MCYIVQSILVVCCIYQVLLVSNMFVGSSKWECAPSLTASKKASTAPPEGDRTRNHLPHALSVQVVYQLTRPVGVRLVRGECHLQTLYTLCLQKKIEEVYLHSNSGIHYTLIYHSTHTIKAHNSDPFSCRFNCCDMDADGKLTYADLWHFYRAQLDRVTGMVSQLISQSVGVHACYVYDIYRVSDIHIVYMYVLKYVYIL